MTRQDEPWYRTAFDGDYLDIYAHRTDEAARTEVAWLQNHWNLEPGSHLLDLACGNGRHAAAWEARGIDVVGADLSSLLLGRARERGLNHARFLRADMACLPFSRAFDAVTSFFTSFGYFESREEDRSVLEEIYRVLVPGGLFSIDFLNASMVKASLVPESESRRGTTTLRQFRSISSDGTRVEKRIEVFDENELVRTSRESVRLYDRTDIELLLAEAGFEIDQIFGALDGRPWSDEAPRLVVTSRSK